MARVRLARLAWLSSHACKKKSSIVVAALEAATDLTVTGVGFLVVTDTVQQSHTQGPDGDPIVHLEMCAIDANFQSASR